MKKENGHYIINESQAVNFKELLTYFLEKRETVGVSVEEAELLEAELPNFLDISLSELTYKKLTGLDLPSPES